MAAVIGAALATLVGSSPLAGLSSRHLQAVAILLGLAGLALLGVTMLFILRVLQPLSVSMTQVQAASARNGMRKDPLRE